MPSIDLAKTGRLALPSAAEAASVQAVAMEQATMPPVVPFKPQAIGAAVQPANVAMAQPLQPSAPGQPAQSVSTLQMTAGRSASTATVPAAMAPTAMAPTAMAKGARLVSPPVAPAVAEGRIQPAAAEAIALDEDELTPDMVALQKVIPIPRPNIEGPAGAGSTALAPAALGYVSPPKTVAAVAAIDRRMEFPPAPGDPLPATASESSPELNRLIKRYAGLYGVPESLVHRVVHRESKYDPKAYHKDGPYWGLMQIKYSTAKAMGYQGAPQGLLDAETNLKYAIKYLRGAWLVADNHNDDAIRLYARGYYYDAKRKDMLEKIDEAPTATSVAFAVAPTRRPISAPPSALRVDAPVDGDPGAKRTF